jgi:hypothetical protein
MAALAAATFAAHGAGEADRPDRHYAGGQCPAEPARLARPRGDRVADRLARARPHTQIVDVDRGGDGADDGSDVAAALVIVGGTLVAGVGLAAVVAARRRHRPAH